MKKILVDGVIFYIQKGRPAGISRVWTALLTELAKTPLAEQIILLDRAKTAPDIAGIKKLPIWEFKQENFQAEAIALQRIMDTEKADLFISTYNTYPENSPCMIVIHDMTPEIMAHDLSHPEWRAKAKAIEKSCAYLTVSQSSKNDFHKIYPQFANRPIFVISNAVSGNFRVHHQIEIDRFRRKYKITKPYFIFCGHRLGYKNAMQFFRAFSLLPNPEEFEVLCTGGAKKLESIYTPYLKGSQAKVVFLSDDELSTAYSGAQALVYSSLYEGFGLPVLEAMASGCPVIANRNSSLIEVVADAGILVENHDINMTCQALQDVGKPSIRKKIIEKGHQNVQRFSWEKSGQDLYHALSEILAHVDSVPRNETDPITDSMTLIYSLVHEPAYKNLRTVLTESVSLWNDPNPVPKMDLYEKNEKALIQLCDQQIHSILERAVEIDQADPLFQYWFGTLLRAKGELTLAFKQFEAALQRVGPKIRLTYLAARTALDSKRMITAGKYYDLLFQSVPDWSYIQSDLSFLKKELDSVKEGLQRKTIEVTGQPMPYNATELGASPVVSIILPTKDREQGLQEILESLPDALGAIPYEILLYPGNELSPEIEEMCKHYPVTQVIYDREIFQPGEIFTWTKLMRHGFESAKGDWLVYASDDIVFFPGSFAQALALAANDPQVGGVTFMHRNTVETYGGIFTDYGFDTIAGLPYINFGIVRRSAYQKVEGFDTRFRFYWGDVDLCAQLWQAGFKIIPSVYSLVDHNNIVDQYRTENSGDRYFVDTKAFVEKWKNQPLFYKKEPLGKERISLNAHQAQQVISTMKAFIKDNQQVQPPLLSAIVSTYNAERFLRGCLEDLESQTIADRMEIIVVNSGSAQDEGRIVKEFQKRYSNIKYIETVERETVYGAWNRAIQQAHGKYITNANTDDRHTPDALEKLIAALEADHEVDVVYADCAVTQTENTTLQEGPITGRFRWPAFDRNTLFKNCIVGPQPVWRKTLHDQFGLFDAQMRSAGDYEFWLRISADAKFQHIPEVLGLYLESTNSLEHQQVNTALQEAQAARERYWHENQPLPTPDRIYLEYYTQGFSGENQLPLVSVIMPTYNRPKELAQALHSVARQTYPNIEVVVVNDAGQDVSDIVQSSPKNIQVNLVQHSANQGAGAARNTGLQAARGKYIAFLDDDDLYRPEHLAALVAELEFNPRVIATYSDGLRILVESTSQKPKVLEKKVVYSEPFSRELMLAQNFIPINCLVVRKDAVNASGGFNNAFPALEDWEWLIRLSFLGDFSHLPFVTNEYHVKAREKSRNILRADQLVRLYLEIYVSHIQKTTPEIRARQIATYHQMTGRDLAQDLPDLYGIAKPKKQPQPDELLNRILDADDVAAAVQAHRADLTPALIDLVRERARDAHQNKSEELADGLETLADYIAEVIANNQA